MSRREAKLRASPVWARSAFPRTISDRGDGSTRLRLGLARRGKMLRLREGLTE
jgi:hypothetical protein